MADTLVKVVDGRTVVTVFGSELLAPLVTAATVAAAAVAADRVQTGLDRVATAGDRVQTGLDRTAVSDHYDDILAIQGMGDDAAAIAARAGKAANLGDLASVEDAKRNLGDFATAALLESQSVSAVLTTITTHGYAAAGDGGGASFKRVGSEPSHYGKRQSADGQWWEISTIGDITPEMVGAMGYATVAEARAGADQSVYLNRAKDVALALKRPLGLLRFYGQASALTVSSPGMAIHGTSPALCGLVTTTASTAAHHGIYVNGGHGFDFKNFSITHRQAASGFWDSFRANLTVGGQTDNVWAFDARVVCMRLVDCDDISIGRVRLGCSEAAFYPASRPFMLVLMDSCSNCHVNSAVGRYTSFGFNITGDDAWRRSYFSASASTDELSIDPLVWAGAVTGDTATLRVWGSGVLPTGVDDATTYYVIKTGTSPLIKLATTYANAIAGTAINLTTDGTTGFRQTQITLTLRSTACTIDAATDEITVDAAWWAMVATADRCVFAQGQISEANGGRVVPQAPGGGVYPGGTTYDTTYYIIKSVTPNVIKLATSSANASGGTAINLTSSVVGAYLVIGPKDVYSNNDNIGVRPLSVTENCTINDSLVEWYRGHAFNVSTGRGCWGNRCVASLHDEFVGSVRSERAAFQNKHSYGDGADANGFRDCAAVNGVSIGFQAQEGKHWVLDTFRVENAEYDAVVANSAPNGKVRALTSLGTKRTVIRAISSPAMQIEGYDVVAHTSGASVLCSLTSSGSVVFGAGRLSGTFAASIMADSSSGPLDILPGFRGGHPLFIAVTTGRFPLSAQREIDMNSTSTAALLDAAGGVVVGRFATLNTVASDTTARFTCGRVGSAGSMIGATALGSSGAQLGGTVHAGASSGTVNTTSNEITVAAAFYALLGTGATVNVASHTASLPAPLLPNTTYYVIMVGSNVIKLAASSLDASGGTAIDLTTAGANDLMIRLTSWSLLSGGVAAACSTAGASGKALVSVGAVQY